MPGLFADRTVRRIVLPLLLTEFLWGMGMYFVLPTTTVPAYLQSLAASKALIGCMAVAMSALPMATQFAGRGLLERFKRRKRGLILLHVLAIVPYFALPVADLLLPTHHHLLVWLVVGGLALSQIIMGCVLPVWLDMIAQVVPITVRGRYFGISMTCLAVGGILGGVALSAMQHWLGAAIFRGAFMATGLCFSCSMLALSCAPIPERAFLHPPSPPLFRRIREALAAAHLRYDFGRFVLSNTLHTLALAVLPFFVGYATATQGLHLSAAIFAPMTIIQACGGAVGAFVLGWLVDHHGPRWPWVVMTLFMPAVALLYPLGGFMPLFVGCTFVTGMLTTSWAVTAPAMLELSPDGDKSAYIALTNLAALAPATVGPFIMAGLIEGSGYRAAFLATAVAGVLAFFVALTLRGRTTGRSHKIEQDEVTHRCGEEETVKAVQ